MENLENVKKQRNGHGRGKSKSRLVWCYHDGDTSEDFHTIEEIMEKYNLQRKDIYNLTHKDIIKGEALKQFYKDKWIERIADDNRGRHPKRGLTLISNQD